MGELADGTTKTQAHQAALREKNPAGKYRIRMIGLAIVVVVCVLVSLGLGRYSVSPLEIPSVLYTLFAQWMLSTFGAALPAWPTDVDAQALVAVGQVRLPRVIVCAFVGAALSVAGASYQGMFQNPMASQDVLGASSGAAFGAALGIFLGVGAAGTSAFAFAFGLIAVAASFGISRISRQNEILSMILAGMVISSLCSSGTSFLKLVADTEDTLPAITYWLMGSLASVRSGDVLPVVLTLVIVSIPLFVLRWRMNLLATGEEEARSMGLNATRLRIVVIICATLLTATCVSISGLIGWVGLVIPHFCRLILGNDYRRIIPACMLFGAAFLLVVDDFSRMIATSEIPIGILTSFIGAPVFIWLLVKGGKNGR